MNPLLTSTLITVSAILVAAAETKPIRVLIWDERQPEQKQAYGDRFLGETIAAHLAKDATLAVTNAWRDQPGDGVPEEVLDSTDVIVWWSHKIPRNVSDEAAERVVRRVMEGKLGLISLHSAHWSKPFVRLMQERTKADALSQVPENERNAAEFIYVNESPYGKVPKNDDPLTPSWEKSGNAWKVTLPSCVFPVWRADGQPSHVTTLLPEHPIAKGLPAKWDIPQTEMYGEPFHVPKPDAVIFEERWDKGEHFRSGCLWTVGKGKVFYFRPGHETYPVFKQAGPLKVIENAVHFLGAK